MIIIGASGHAKDLLVVLNEKANNNNLFFYDDYTKPEQDFFLNKYQILHSFNEIDFKAKPLFATAIGIPISRKLIVDKFINAGGVYTSIISEKAIIGSHEVVIGEGCNIMPNVFISNSVSIGIGCLVNTAAHIHHDVTIGDYCDISPGARVLGRAKIGSNCNIGSGAIILPNVILGDNITVGAGAVVVEDCLNKNTIVGIPGKIRK